jgi:VWFA-related protein
MVALGGHASAVAPAGLVRASGGQSPMRHDVLQASAQAARGEGQNDQSRQGDRGGSAAQRGQNPPASGQADGQTPQDQTPQDQTPATPLFRTGVDFVRVDVIVSDRSGNTVGDLKQTDFEVTEDGKPQQVETFRLVKLDGGSSAAAQLAEPPRPIRNDEDEAAEAAKDDVRLFAVFLDDYHVREGTSLSARAAISKWVDSQLGPSDMIGVMHPLESIDSVRMTRNHAIISKAIQQFRGRKGNYTPENEFEQNYANYPAETVEQIRNQVSLSAIKALIVHMGGLKEGRKALVLVSEGYSNILPASLRDPVASMPGLGNPSAGNPNAGLNDPNETRYAFFAGQDLEFFMQGVYEVASQNNVSIYTVDPRGLPVFEYDIDRPVNPTIDGQFLSAQQNTLRALAVETDGRAIMNRNDLDVGMKQIIRDSSGYYLLGYTTHTKADGKFHSISVKVKRPGVQVRSRKGYWSLTAPAAAAVDSAAAKKLIPPTPVDAALNTLATSVQPKSARLVRTWIGTTRGENGKTRVTFVWEPAPKSGERLGAAGSGGDQPARVMVTAVGPDGSPYFRGRVPDAASSAAASSETGVRGPSRVTFDVAPGKMQLRLSVEGNASQVLDTEVRDVTIPDLTSAQVVLGTPEVFRARVLKEFQQIKADPNAVPVTAREFSRTERVLMRVAAYAPGTAVPAVKARLLSRAGQAMSELAVAPSAAPGGPFQIDLPLSGLAPGEYVVEISATAEGGGDAKELVGFRVTA